MSRCRLTSDQLDQLRDFYAARAARAHLTTAADVVDGAGTTVCHGTFTWSLRRGDQYPPDP